MSCTIDDLVSKAREYLPPEKVMLIEEAFRYSAEAHKGQQRASGVPYIEHPLEVARILTELQLDASTVASALLHDVVEDTGVPLADVKGRFGQDVADLVEGVTKLGKIETKTAASPADPTGKSHQTTLQAESLRKMLVAMAEDVRVILIKLADRLHNMRTIQALPPQKQARIAQETLDIYAPLAHRLGIASVQWQLEDLAFRTLHPEEYKEISALLATTRAKREAFMERVLTALKTELDKAGIKAEVTGRAKHIFSIHRKMQRYAAIGRDFHQIHDLIAVRVLADDIRSCYETLGLVHSLWHPIRGEFDDYIANPRENGYQSLHTSVLGPDMTPVEVQIRTYRMHDVAEYGVAAHWRYKHGHDGDMRVEEKMAWMRQLLEYHKEEAGAEAFVESVKTDIFRDQVFVYTPKGQVRELPAGATPIDFAYSIHTDLGHNCAGAKINGKMVPLDHTLQSGDTVEIIRKADKGPSLDWLNVDLGYAQTANARAKIRHWFRRRARHENVERGRVLLDKEMRRLHVGLAEDTVAKLMGYENVDELLAALGSGTVSQQQLAPKLLPPAPEPDIPPALKATPLPVDGSPAMRVMGMSGLAVRLAKCCTPVPGDSVAGFVTRLRGVTVHRKDCPNFVDRKEAEVERVVEVEWGAPSKFYEARIAIKAWDRVGLLRDITTLVSTEKVNIAEVSSSHHKNGAVTEHLTLQLNGANQLSRLLSRMESVKGVIHVEREG